ncbi:MAG: MFS transporter, partial [Chloroflexi bacterium]|nr:MFS transporter [Chloroflexota bacterium]
GLRIGNGTSPIIAQVLVGSFGWRSAFFVLGAVTWIVALLPAFLFLRRRPEDMGLLPDGDPPRDGSGPHDASGNISTQGTPPAAIDVETNFTLRQALRTRSFYFLGISSFFGLTVASGVSLNLVPYLEDQGMSATTAVASITILSVVSMSTALASGFVGERVSVRAILTVTYVGMAIGVVFLTRVDTPFLSFVYAVFYGMLFGFMSTLFHMIYPDYFGRNSIGSIRGMTTPLQMGAIALGPLMASVAFDSSGEYTAVFLVFGGLFLLSALFVGMAAKPSAPTASARHGDASAEHGG